MSAMECDYRALGPCRGIVAREITSSYNPRNLYNYNDDSGGCKIYSALDYISVDRVSPFCLQQAPVDVARDVGRLRISLDVT
jgi:hypothetical protein